MGLGAGTSLDSLGAVQEFRWFRIQYLRRANGLQAFGRRGKPQDDVDDGADQGPQDVGDLQGNGVGVAESGILLEGGDGEEERDTE